MAITTRNIAICFTYLIQITSQNIQCVKILGENLIIFKHKNTIFY
jgi:hypothetical protein